jgi:hypothetical protein
VSAALLFKSSFTVQKMIPQNRVINSAGNGSVIHVNLSKKELDNHYLYKSHYESHAAKCELTWNCSG